MRAYQDSDLYNKYVNDQATGALETFCIDKDSFTKILTTYPCKLYTPDYFIRIALGLLTIVAVLFSALLLWLLSSASSTPGIVIVLIILAILCYTALELLVQAKRYYNAGVDNILMVLTIIFIDSVFFVSDYNTSWIGMSGVTMFVALWLSIRFTDAFMAMLTYCCFFIFLFLVYLKFGDIAKATAPVIMMIVSAVICLLLQKLSRGKMYSYQYCFKAVTFLSLVTLYASGNYFIIKELSNEMFHLQLSLQDPIPFGWLFWMLTFLIPPAYIIYGIRKRDFLVMRTGLALIAATVFTVKYYYALLPVEMEMLIAGIILIALSYTSIKYLAMPKYGYTSIDLYPSRKEALNAEALIIAETFNKQPVVESSGLYGGGSGGGGGATGEF